MDPLLTPRTDRSARPDEGDKSPIILPASPGALEVFTEVVVKNHFRERLPWLVPYLIDFTWRAITASPLGVMHPSRGASRVYGLCEILNVYQAVRAEQESGTKNSPSPEAWSKFHFELAENVLECLSRVDGSDIKESTDGVVLQVLPISPPDFLALELQRASRLEAETELLGPPELERLAYAPEALVEAAAAVRQHFLNATR